VNGDRAVVGAGVDHRRLLHDRVARTQDGDRGDLRCPDGGAWAGLRRRG
jgi:hypothetical protein